MQKLMLNLYLKAYQAAEFLSPSLAGRWAIRTWVQTPKNKRPAYEEEMIQGAQRETFKTKGGHFKPLKTVNYQTYSWGNGPVVLLVHGWGGRGSQLAALVPSLLESGYKVVAFDAVAHGDSEGDRTNVQEMSEIIKDISQREPQFHSIVAHSLGGLAAGIAIQSGVKVGKLVTVATAASIHYYLNEFATQMGASSRTMHTIKEHMESYFDSDLDRFSMANVVSELNIPGLIIHDKNDKEVRQEEALVLSKQWEDSQLMLTEGLGHRRILGDSTTIQKITNFVGPATSFA